MTVGNVQLKALYKELLQHIPVDQRNSGKSLQTIAELQKQIETEQVNVEHWKCKCEELKIELNRLKQQNSDLEQKLIHAETNLELECYRTEAKVYTQWDAREGRLVQQLVKLQHQWEPEKELYVPLKKTELLDTTGISPGLSCSETTLTSSVVDRHQQLKHTLSTTQPIRRVQWQDLDDTRLQTHSGGMLCPESSVPMSGLSCSQSPVSGAA